ncbi:MAG: hypothetical protein H7338_05935, partial [Candidatus Sericytochromatia bacterium]|nr:hypothetical protein [Candidatus Sericytochromatia bacterium]
MKRPDGMAAASCVIFSLTPGSGNLAIEGLLSRVLRRQGTSVAIVVCNGIRSRCSLELLRPQVGARTATCITCVANTEEALADWAGTRADVSYLGDWVDPHQLASAETAIAALTDEALLTYTFDGLPLGSWINIALRVDYFGELWRELPDWPAKARLWLQSTVATALAASAYFRRERPDSVLVLSGITPSERAIWALAERHGVRCVMYEGGQRPAAIILRDRSPACLYDFSPEWHDWANVPLSIAESCILDQTLHTRRRSGPQSLFVLSPPETTDLAAVRAELGLTTGRPVLVAFPSCSADASGVADAAFPSQTAWLEACVAFAVTHPEVDLVVRVHPAEEVFSTNRGGRHYLSRNRAADVIARRWPQLPANVRVVPAASATSSYDLVQLATLVLTYVSTLGLEAAALGPPVITAARPHYCDVGFVWPVASAATFVVLLERQLAEPAAPPYGRELARRYMYFWLLRCTPTLPGLPSALADQMAAPVTPLPFWEGPGDAGGPDRIADYLTGQGPFVLPPPAWRYRDADLPLPVGTGPVPLVVVVPDDWPPEDLAEQGLAPLLAAGGPVRIKVVTAGLGMIESARCLDRAQRLLAGQGEALGIELLPPDTSVEALGRWLMIATAIIGPRADGAPVMDMADALHVPVLAPPADPAEAQGLRSRQLQPSLPVAPPHTPVRLSVCIAADTGEGDALGITLPSVRGHAGGILVAVASAE